MRAPRGLRFLGTRAASGALEGRCSHGQVAPAWSCQTGDVPDRETRRLRLGAAIFGLIAVAILAFAAYNYIYVPALDPADPNRGWAWLTSDVETVDYIKFYFRMQGIWQLGFAILVLAAAGCLHHGSRRAWLGLWSVPVVLLLVGAQAPWTLPVLAAPILLSLVALMLTWREVG